MLSQLRFLILQFIQRDMDEDQMQAMRDHIVDEYTELLSTTPNDELISATFLKLSKVALEFEILSDGFLAQKYDTIETLIRIDVLLGAVGGIRGQIKEALK